MCRDEGTDSGLSNTIFTGYPLLIFVGIKSGPMFSIVFELEVVTGYKVLVGNYALDIGHHKLQLIDVSLFLKVLCG